MIYLVKPLYGHSIHLQAEKISIFLQFFLDDIHCFVYQGLVYVIRR